MATSDSLCEGPIFYFYHYKKRHIRDILGRTKKIYVIVMTIIVTKPGIIIDVVGSYFDDKKS